MAPTTFTTLPFDVRRLILEEAFDGSQIRISYRPQYGGTLSSDEALKVRQELAQSSKAEPLALASLVNSARPVPADSDGAARVGILVCKSCNDLFGPVVTSRQLYEDSLAIFVQCTTFVLESGVAWGDLLACLPPFWKTHAARVQAEGGRCLPIAINGLKELTQLKYLRLGRNDGGHLSSAQEIVKQSDEAVLEMVLRYTGFLKGLKGVNTLAELASFAPSVEIVLACPLSISSFQYTMSTSLQGPSVPRITYHNQPNIDVEIHTKPPRILLNGLTIAEFRQYQRRAVAASKVDNLDNSGK